MLLHTSGKTFLQHALDRLQQVCDQVAISSTVSLRDDVLVILDSSTTFTATRSHDLQHPPWGGSETVAAGEGTQRKPFPGLAPEPAAIERVTRGPKDSIQNAQSPPYPRGPVVGIATLLQYARQHDYKACFVTPVDTPFITIEDLERLQSQWQRDQKLTIAVSDRIEPLIGIYPVELADELERVANSQDRSLFRWIQMQDYTLVPIPADRAGNINTPEDFSENGS